MPLTEPQIAILGRLADAIIPRDGTPGAADTPVVPMILMVAASWLPEQQQAFAGGLDAIDAVARAVFGAPALELDDARFAALVAEVAGSEVWAEFWGSLRALVCLNFYALPQGYQPIGLPGPSIDSGGQPL
jgi:hypothetical protein